MACQPSSAGYRLAPRASLRHFDLPSWYLRAARTRQELAQSPRRGFSVTTASACDQSSLPSRLKVGSLRSFCPCSYPSEPYSSAKDGNNSEPWHYVSHEVSFDPVTDVVVHVDHLEEQWDLRAVGPVNNVNHISHMPGLVCVLDDHGHSRFDMVEDRIWIGCSNRAHMASRHLPSGRTSLFKAAQRLRGCRVTRCRLDRFSMLRRTPGRSVKSSSGR